MCHRKHKSRVLRDVPGQPADKAARRSWCGGGKLLLAALVVAALGCIDTRGRSWVEDTDRQTLPTIGTRRVSVETDNGYVQIRPAADDSDEIEVLALIRAGGRDAADAEHCREAIEIITPVEGQDDTTQRIGWAWREPKQSQWQAAVSFEISMPARLPAKVRTQNGKIDVVGVAGDCDVETQNGDVRVIAANEHLTVKSNNGELLVESPASQVDIQSHNGQIVAALGSTSDLSGVVTSANGNVRVSLSETANVQLDCRTRNGRVTAKSISLSDVEKEGRSRKSLSGRLGTGGGKLEVRTKNGNIVVQPYARHKASAEVEAE